MKHLTKIILTLAVVNITAGPLQAQLPLGSHYAIGSEGLDVEEVLWGLPETRSGEAVSLSFSSYYAGSIEGLPARVKNANYFTYGMNARDDYSFTNFSLLGANWGVNLILPFTYKNITGDLGTAGQFNLGDIYVCPLRLSWYLKQFDFSAEYGLWTPSGNFDASTLLRRLDSPGDGYWTHMLTVGGVWHPDAKKQWSLALLNRYEINTEQDHTRITPGNMYSLEWGVSKTVFDKGERWYDGLEVGLVGYWQQEITQDDGPQAATALSHVVGIGAEVRLFRLLGPMTLRYEYEVDAKDRPQGHTVVLTMTF